MNDVVIIDRWHTWNNKFERGEVVVVKSVNKESSKPSILVFMYTL